MGIKHFKTAVFAAAGAAAPLAMVDFWADWCGPCKMEMPDIQALYEDWDENAGELVVLGVAGPNIGQEGSAEDITAFLEENGYTYPVVMDETGRLFYQYGISAYPTTFMIDTEGNVFGYVQGAVSREVMEEVGLKVKNLRYYKSQPWSFSGTLLFGFFCDIDGDDTLTVDHEELSIAQWFERDKIIGQDTDSSLTNEMMMAFAAGKEPK